MTALTLRFILDSLTREWRVNVADLENYVGAEPDIAEDLQAVKDDDAGDGLEAPEEITYLD